MSVEERYYEEVEQTFFQNYLRFSKDLVNWSHAVLLPGTISQKGMGLDNPVFANIDYTSNTLVSADGFYVVGSGWADGIMKAIKIYLAILINGNFEDFTDNTPSGSPGKYAHVTNWYDSGQWTAWQQDENWMIPPNPSSHVALGPGGYIYQSLGNYTSAYGSLLDISMELTDFTDGKGWAIISVHVFAGEFLDAADGVDILGHSNQPTLIGTYDSGIPYAEWEDQGNIGPWIFHGNIDLSNVPENTQVWLRISGSNGYGPVDNISTKFVQKCIGDEILSDLNNDCKVDLQDLLILSAHWLECNRYGDVNCPEVGLP